MLLHNIYLRPKPLLFPKNVIHFSQDSRDDDKHSTPIQSVDSALESWDSSRSGMESNSHSSGNTAHGSTSANPHSNQTSVGDNKETISTDSGAHPNQNQTVSGQVTVHRSQNQQSDHRTVPTREELVEDEKTSKPPVAQKPVFCNSHNCRLSHANRGVQVSQEYQSRSSKSNPNLLSSSSDYPDSYYKKMGHVHNLHNYHYNSESASKTPGCQDDLHIKESSDNINIKDSHRRDSHYHSDPDLSGSPDNAVAIDNRALLDRKFSGDQFLRPVVSVSKASTPDPTISKGMNAFTVPVDRSFVKEKSKTYEII